MNELNSMDFKASDFTEGKTPEGLIAVLKKDGFKIQEGDAITSLNGLLINSITSDHLLDLARQKLLSKEALDIFSSNLFMENAKWPLRPQEVKAIICANYPHEAPGN